MSNCHPEIFLFSIISQYICSILSIPIYAITFSVLIFKCPKHFDNRYRNYLIAHLVSGVLLEIQMSIFWRANVPVPIPILCSNVIGALAAGFTALVTYNILNSKSVRISKKTASIQKNLLNSLLAAFLVHIILIFLPLFMYFLVNFITINYSFAAEVFILMLQEHGACSAVTLLLTSNLLRSSVKKLVKMS
ncbi:hypothetical protein L5515_009455 [Caenorhabditis briggsae]|uniref:Uncharacterized protein n=1 Tax=Caenorhabditis briggsae TaxID=6238 RepID=A0AAE9FBN7_CAEBR|nr:hypothetical protein L5515_009455 [Caenorhabditis briggsae]